MPRTWTNRARSLALLAVSALVAPAPQLRGADQSDLPERARQAYYSLKRAGLVEFRCQVIPDWQAIYASLKADAAGEEVRKLAEKTHFEVAIGADGASAVSHQSDGAPPSQQLAERLRQITGGVEQILTGFFQVWSQFMYGSVFGPDDKDLKIDDLDGQYRITQKQGQAAIVILMNRELLITEAQIDLPEFGVTLHPKFARQPQGYVFVGYASNMKMAANSIQTELTLENQELQGLALPKTITAVIAGGIRIRLNFSGYDIKKRDPSAPN